MNAKEVIEKNFSEFYELAKLAMETRRYNAAVTLYYKVLVELCDLSLLRAVNKIGANHSERFLLLKANMPQLYDTSSKVFRFYRDSYNKEISQTIAEAVKNEVEKARQMVLGTEKDQRVDKGK